MSFKINDRNSNHDRDDSNVHTSVPSDKKAYQSHSVSSIKLNRHREELSTDAHALYERSNGIDTSAQFSSIPSSQKEPIAIVGIGCRLPGGASSPEKLWELISNGGSSHCEVPGWRYNAEAFYHPNSDRPGCINSTGGYLIQEDVTSFENTFFGINNVEAQAMDPQQRKLLEVTFECFESAGISLSSIDGANIGCYVANFTSDYAHVQQSEPEYSNRYTAIGTSTNALANRISYTFNLTGPSVALDTACSSSRYSLHFACTALDSGECESAIVPSANLIQSPQQQMIASKAGILSSHSVFKTFDSSADGYGRAEGVGALLLKRLTDAVRDGDPVRAVIRGTAVNSNGKANGIMQPSSAGQEDVIKRAYMRANLSSNETDYVEAHGTGTAVGDPIEVRAISNTFNHKSGQKTLVGSLKTNMGHSELTSGISSVIKTVLALEHRSIPPTVGIEDLSPDIREFMENIEIVRVKIPWPNVKHPRASINSFGFGGANAHVILEPMESHVSVTPEVNHRHHIQDDRRFVLPVSAASVASLQCRVEDLKRWDLSNLRKTEIGSIAYTLGSRRTVLPYRGYMLIDKLQSGTALQVDHTQTAEDRALTPRKLGFMFTGQGAQWPHMGQELFKAFPVFQDTIRKLDSFLACLEQNSLPTLTSILLDTEQHDIDVNQPQIAQVLCTTVQVALVDLLYDWDVKPAVVVGHSSGEIAAAYACGFLTLSQAIVVAFYRGLATTTRTARTLESISGAMLAVDLDQDSARSHINVLQIGSVVNIACINSPENVTVSGDAEAIDQLKERLDRLKVFNRKLKTNGMAYHSHHMRGVVGHEYQKLITPHFSDRYVKSVARASIKMISSLNGEKLSRSQAASPDYWRKNLENPVLFDPAVREMFAQNDLDLIEVGPHPALQSAVQQIRESVECSESKTTHQHHSTLIRNKNGVEYVLKLAGTLFIDGYRPNFNRVNRLASFEMKVCPNLPNYAWDYKNSIPIMNRARTESCATVFTGVTSCLDRKLWEEIMVNSRGATGSV